MTTRDAMREQLRIKPADLEAVNAVLAGPDNRLVGRPPRPRREVRRRGEINRKADEAGRLETRLARLQDEGSPFLAGLSGSPSSATPAPSSRCPSTGAASSAPRPTP